MARICRCLSEEKHSGDDIVDPVVHYFGCLLMCERDAYFESLESHQQDKIEVELRRVERLRRFVQLKRQPHQEANSDEDNENDNDTDDDHSQSEGQRLVDNFKNSLMEWRQTLTDRNTTWNAVRKHRLGRRKNCCPPLPKNNIQQGDTKTNGNAMSNIPNGTPHEPVNTDCTPKDSERNDGSGPDNEQEYDPSKDIKAYLTQYEKLIGTGSISKSSSSEEDTTAEHDDSASQDERVTAVWKDEFIAQKSFVHDLLVKPVCEGEENYLSRNHGTNKLRYFHFPLNNMQWVEQAMSRYYDEVGTKYGDGRPTAKPPKRTRANMILRHEFWKGQQHGNHASFIHARHLRPLCELVSSNPSTAERSPKNLVLFMPILHWDTDRKYQTFAKKIAKLTGDARRKEEDREWKAAQKRYNTQIDLLKEINKNIKPIERPKRTGTVSSLDSVPGVVLAQSQNHPFRSGKSHKIEKDQFERLLLKSKLAQVFYDAFRLMEEMDNYRDSVVLEDYLYQSSPLHPRRTLDQAYYCSIKNTKVRDRDQVVYRETTPRDGDLHRWDYDEKGNVNWKCADWSDQPDAVPPYLDMTDQQAYKRTKLQSRCIKCFRLNKNHKKDWIGLHGATCRYTKDSDELEAEKDSDSRQKIKARHSGQHGCKHCGSAALRCGCKKLIVKDAEDQDVEFPRNLRQDQKRQCTRCHENIKMLSRLIMVDQLWMWILDEKTILTFFPRRYGVNRQDASGIHKAIRNRIKQARNKQIISVFDLALIILSECTKTFFDRTRTPDMQPRVLDLFSEAIGRVTHNQTIAFNHMWESAEKLRRASSIPSSADLSDLHIPLLNIAPEGMLQREIKDILDELGIMLHLVEQQKAVVDKFVKNVKTILSDEDGKPDPDCNDKSPALRWFETSSEELTADLTSHHLELQSLKQSATSTSEGLDHLMSLKQQSASVIQAWQAIRQGDEAVKQGRAIMIFTTMTIIFLPLAFIAAIFGMNNSELTPADDDDKSPMSFKKQLKLMFGISIGIIAIVLVFAFSTLARAWCWSACHKTAIWLATRLWIYRFWLKKRKIWGSESRFKLAEIYEKKAKSRESGAARKRYAHKVDLARYLKMRYLEEKEKNLESNP